MHDYPVYLALDVWQALGGDVLEFDGYLERNGRSETWASLVHYIRVLNGESRCGAHINDIDGPCVLLAHSDSSPHYGADDVGRSEPLPFVVKSRGDL